MPSESKIGGEDQKAPRPAAAAVRCMFWTAQATASISSISGIAYLFASITLSRNLVVNLIIFANLSQSIVFSFSDSITNFPTSIEPKLQD